MECIYCSTKMEKDDVDYNFKGNFDIYWLCPKCGSCCIEEVRFSQPYCEIWHSELYGKEEVVYKKK